jgi:hypothetical protein
MVRDNMPALSSDALNRQFGLAQKGRAFWLKHNLDQYHRILMFPEKNGLLAAQVMDMLGEKPASMQGLTALNQKLLACLTAAPSDQAPGIEWIHITKEEAEGLLILYSMYEFTDKLIFVSLDKPYGRKLYNLIETGFASEKELINEIILEALHGKEA